MYRFTTFDGALPAPSAVSPAPTGPVPDAPLWPPQPLNANAHPSARIATGRTLNITRFPFFRASITSGCFISQPGPRGQGLTSNVQEQMLAFPGTDDLREGFVLGFLDRGKGQYEAIAEQVHQRLGLSQQAQGLRQSTRQGDCQIVGAARYGFGRLEAFDHAEIAAGQGCRDREVG